MRIKIGEGEEWYPYYEVSLPDDGVDGPNIIKVSDADGRRWLDAQEAFERAQAELAELQKETERRREEEGRRLRAAELRRELAELEGDLPRPPGRSRHKAGHRGALCGRRPGVRDRPLGTGQGGGMSAIYIVAGTYRQAMDYADRHGLDGWAYAGEGIQLWGVDGARIIMVGTWRQHFHAANLEREAIRAAAPGAPEYDDADGGGS